MRNFVLASFFGYITVFAILQQIIGRRRSASNIVRYQYLMFEICRSLSLILVTIGVLRISDDNLTTWPVIRFIGTAICAAGLLLSMRAQYELGKFWVGGIGIHKGHKLITTGVYRYVRHPLYTGMLISGIGLCLISLNIFYGLGSLLFAGAYALRAPFEDMFLEKKFKKKYQAYASTTGAVFPRIRKKC